MSVANPQSTIKLFNVPWGKNDKNFKMFDSRATQTSRFLDYIATQTVKYEGIEFNIVKNGVIKIPVCAYNVNKYNYMMFSNPDVTSSRTYWYAFIDRVEWGSYNTAHVYYTLDAWQNYQFDITYKDCFVERMHITKAEDNENYLKYTAPEPMSFSASVGKLLASSSAEWKPAWMLNSVSTFDVNSQGTTYDFYYGGYDVGTSEATGGYSFPLSQMTNLQLFLSIFRDTTLVQASHLSEIINMTCVPKWVENICLNSSPPAISADTYSGVPVYKMNPAIATSEYVSDYEPEKLACGYVPRNKKLFTSLAKVFVIHNKNGLTLPLKPELFDFSDNPQGHENQPSMWFQTKPLNTNSIKGDVLNYKSTESEFTIPYGASLGIGFNANEGVANFMNKLSAVYNVGGYLGNVFSHGVSGNVAGFASDIMSVPSLVEKTSKAFDSQYAQAGSCTDTMSVSATMVAPEYWDKSPTYEECEILDNYLDVYGYAVNKRMNPTDAMSTRPAWNYIKVTKLDAKINAPDDMASVIRSAFESGCHIWHGYIQNVGDFSGNNS